MDVLLITPARRRARTGNRTTADRWSRLLRRLGHRVAVATAYDGRAADVLVAIHAWRSAESVARFRARFPDRPLIVGLGGTDINEYLYRDPAKTLATLEMADALVGLHRKVFEAVPETFHPKLRVILQSAEPLPESLLRPSVRTVDICVIAHLREVKDPLRAAEAARLLPAFSRVRILHFGKAHDRRWEARARAETATNPRYLWKGEAPHWRVRRVLGRSHAMVLSSRQEGGANVVSEAVVAGLPVLASRIPGTTGLLGDDYPGYFPVGDTEALARLLWRVETDAVYFRLLRRCCRARRALFHPARELRAWRDLLASVPSPVPSRRGRRVRASSASGTRVR